MGFIFRQDRYVIWSVRTIAVSVASLVSDMKDYKNLIKKEINEELKK